MMGSVEGTERAARLLFSGFAALDWLQWKRLALYYVHPRHKIFAFGAFGMAAYNQLEFTTHYISKYWQLPCVQKKKPRRQ
jgi:hypothetical protein